MKLPPDFMQAEPGLLYWLIVPFILTIILWNIISMIRNYLRVRSSQIPRYLCPTNPRSIVWMILGLPFKPLLQVILPTFLFDRITPTFYGWAFPAKWTLHARFGNMFFINTPGTNDLWIADPDAAQDILKRPKDFIPLPGTEAIAGSFGQNLLTAHGEQWQKQRRLIAPNFNEGVSALVWSEACSQASEMLEYFLEDQNGETNETINGLRQIAIEVIGEAGYGIRESWKTATMKRKQHTKAETMTYVEAVNSIIDYLLLSILLPTWLFALPIMPQWVRNIGIVKQRFEVLTKEMLENERREAATRPTERKNLMSTLVALSDAEKDNSGSLTEEQISGNLFLFTVAGYETTANTLAYGITTLAAEPKWQQWLFSELQPAITSGGASKLEDKYEDLFPKLPKFRAFMFETLRLYNPLAHIGRFNPAPQTIQTSGGPRLIPARTQCYINGAALHSNPATWGPDVLLFNPQRWLDSKGEIITPAKGTFLPWSTGPRVCPGMKMAQVEFVGVLTTLLSRSKIEIVTQAGEDSNAAQKKLWEVMQDSQTKTTLQMNRPKDVRLRFVRR
jgi:cytochrome P450